MMKQKLMDLLFDLGNDRNLPIEYRLRALETLAKLGWG